MLATSHFIATTSIILIAQKAGLFVSKEVILWCYLLANAIDLDHIVVYPQQSWLALKNFLRLGGYKRVNPDEFNLHSRIQEPWFVFVVWLFTSIAYHYSGHLSVFLPAAALGVHIFLDGIMKFTNYLLWPISKRGFKGFIPSNTTLEYVISVPLAGLLLYLLLIKKLFSF